MKVLTNINRVYALALGKSQKGCTLVDERSGLSYEWKEDLKTWWAFQDEVLMEESLALPDSAFTVRLKFSYIDWDQFDLLGKHMDTEIARTLDVSESAVRQARGRRGIPAVVERGSYRVDWNHPSVTSLLGTLPDSKIACMLGVTSGSVRSAREIRGIPLQESAQTYLDWSKVEGLGQIPDRVLAKKLKVSRNSVTRARVRAGIPPFHEPTNPMQRKIDWSKIIPLLGTVSDDALRCQFNVSKGRIAMKRKQLGIPSFQARDRLIEGKEPVKPFRKIDWGEIIPYLGTAADSVIAAEFEVSESRLGQKRRQLGIKSYRQRMEEG